MKLKKFENEIASASYDAIVILPIDTFRNRVSQLLYHLPVNKLIRKTFQKEISKMTFAVFIVESATN